MNIITIIVGDFSTNCYLVFDEKNTGVVIDPGDSASRILEESKNRGLKIEAILLTHGHCDHLIAARELQDSLNVPLYVHQDDKDFVEHAIEQGHMLGLHCTKVPKINHFYSDALQIGQLNWQIRHVPGHTPGGVIIVGDKVAFCGDTIFRGAIGRTDFIGGNYQQLINSIRTQIYTLPEDTVLYCGHGPNTTVGYEKEHNPYTM
ncbi:MBL fold metallo-hydrolase [bacterium]|nr:MBL fold metallo-hydrolase [bacterium]